MSAFIVNKSHINAMVNAAVHAKVTWHHNGEWREITNDNADAVGQMLLDENIKGVGDRYEDSTITDLPGMANAEYLIPFQSHFIYKVPTPVELIKIIHCYGYQAYEDENWETSEAKKFCDSLESHAISRLPGYEDAPWEWEDPEYYKLNKVTRLV